MTSSLLATSTHNYQQFSEQYSDLQIENTYFLAFTTVGELIERHADSGKRTLDFGCGAGRSTRFLQSLGLDVIGVDISASMLRQAQQTTSSLYYLLEAGKLPFSEADFDIIFQSFVLLEYPSIAQMIETFKEFNRVLDDDGVIVIVTASEDYYRQQWLSFEIDNAEKQILESGCKVKVCIRDTDIVLFDYYWTDDDYRYVFQQSGLEVIEAVQPLAQGTEPFAWVSEREFPCWTIYVLRKQLAN